MFYIWIPDIRPGKHIPNFLPVGCGKVESAAELCQRMLDFCQRLTTAKRKILEDPELYPEDDQDMQVSTPHYFVCLKKLKESPDISENLLFHG